MDKEVILTAKEGFTFGCDPEGFVFKNGIPVSAEMIPGTKAEPFKVPGGAVQRDGFAAEFNIDPVTTFEEFDNNITSVLEALNSFLPKGEGYEIRWVPAVTFDVDTFCQAADDAKELGCQPDYDAWTGDINPPPADPDNPYMRCAAGHLHVGWTERQAINDPQHVLNCRDLVKQMDWYLGAWSTRIDTDPTRRRLYGKAGACRLKDYGVEYRVLSNFWVETREMRLAVWNRMMMAISGMTDRFMPDRASSYNHLVVESINATMPNSALERAYPNPLIDISDVKKTRKPIWYDMPIGQVDQAFQPLEF